MITTFANKAGIANRSSSGLTMAFPDVCKGPVPAAPVPIPYPNFATIAVQAQRVKVQGGTAVTGATALKASMGNEPGVLKEVTQLKTKLNELHAQLQALPVDDPNRWQAVLTDYAVMASALYMTRRGQ